MTIQTNYFAPQDLRNWHRAIAIYNIYNLRLFPCLSPSPLACGAV
ncbi:MAG: hypothetical protein RM338_09305 [Nostoc sp. DedQUE12a]|nr:hypothetical protein [Nostoc sp. DedQUE12a]